MKNLKKISTHILSALAVVTITASPVLAASFLDDLKKDFDKVIDSVQGGMEDLSEGKKDVEKTIDDAEVLKEEFTGVGNDEPRYGPSWVAEVQQRLVALGLNPGPVDGAFGKKTANAIVTFQKISNLSPDGKPRPSMMRALRAKTQSVQTAQKVEPSIKQFGNVESGTHPVGGTSMGQTLQWPAAQNPPVVDLAVYQTAPPVTGTTVYEHLLRRFVQANPSLVNDEQFINGFANRGCTTELLEAKKNEITRFQYLEKVKGRIPAFAAQAAALPDMAVRIPLEVTVSIAQYDFEKKGFPIGAVNEPLIRHDENCDVFAPRTTYPRKFAFSDLEGVPFSNARLVSTLALLPMSQADAQAFLSHGYRSLKLQISFGVGRQEASPDAVVKLTSAREIRSVVTEVRVVDAQTGELLHVFDPQLLAPVSPKTFLTAAVSEPTYERFLEAYLALHPEVTENRDFVLQYVSYLPKTQTCPAEFELLRGNEFAKQQFYSQHWPALAARFRQAASIARAPTGKEVFRAQVESTAGAYDFAAQTFELTLGSGSWGGQGGTVLISDQEKMQSCASVHRTMPTVFAVKFSNRGTISILPLEPTLANALDANNPKRKVDLLVDFVLEDVASDGSAVARIVGVTAFDAVSGQLLHQYDSAMFVAPAADPWDKYPAPSYRELLLALLAQSPSRAQDDSYVERFIATEACQALKNVKDNVFAKRALIASYRTKLVEAAGTGTAEPGQIYKLSFEQSLGPYNFEESKFPFSGSHSSSPAQSQIRIGIHLKKNCFTTQGEAPTAFYATVTRPFTLLQAGLPMPASKAQNLAGKTQMDVLVRLETPGGADGKLSHVTARIVESRLRHVDSNQVLYNYGSDVIGEPGAQAADAYAGVAIPTHEKLLHSYLATRSDLTGDRSFVNRYAATIQCKFYKSANEFDRRALADKARAKLESALGAGSGVIQTLRVSQDLKLGGYDIDASRFSLSVPKTSGHIDSIKLDDPISTLQVKSDGVNCRDIDFSPAFPDIFLLTIDGTEKIDAIGVPMENAAAQSHLTRELPKYTDAKSVRLDLLVRLDEMHDPVRTHPQRTSHMSLVPGTLVAARVVDPVSARVLYSFDLEADSAPPSAIDVLATLPAGVLPAGTEFVQVSQTSATEVRSYVMITGSGLEASGNRINGRSVQAGKETEIPALLRNRANTSVLMSAVQFARAYDRLQGMELRIEPFESPAAAAQRRLALAESGTPYGPAMAGLQLGMNFDEAEAIIRAQMDVGWVIQLPRDENAGVRGMKPYNAGRMFVARDGNQMIGIFDEPPSSSGVVLGAWRRVEVQDPNLVDGDVLALLTEEYGPPVSSRNQSSWAWGETIGQHICGQRRRVKIGDNVVEGPPFDTKEAQEIRYSLSLSAPMIATVDL